MINEEYWFNEYNNIKKKIGSTMMTTISPEIIALYALKLKTAYVHPLKPVINKEGIQLTVYSMGSECMGLLLNKLLTESEFITLGYLASKEYLIAGSKHSINTNKIKIDVRNNKTLETSKPDFSSFIEQDRIELEKLLKLLI